MSYITLPSPKEKIMKMKLHFNLNVINVIFNLISLFIV